MKNLKFLVALLAVGCAFSTSCSNTKSSSDVIRIGMECNYAPFNWTCGSQTDYSLPIYNQAGKYADGYDIQFAKRLEKETGKQVEIYALEWESLIIQLNSNQIDAVIAGMTDTEEREKEISFTNEYYRSELVLVTSKTIADQYTGVELSSDQLSVLLNGKIVESQRGTVTDNVIDTFNTNYKAIHATAVDTFSKAALDVNTGAVFAMTAEYPVAQSIVKNYSSLGIIHMNQDILGVDLSELGVSVGVRKDDTELKNTINNVLANYSQTDRNSDMSLAVERSGSSN